MLYDFLLPPKAVLDSLRLADGAAVFHMGPPMLTIFSTTPKPTAFRDRLHLFNKQLYLF